MLPNLSALDHRAPLASTGPQAAVDRDGATCPISLDDLPKGSLAWQPEIVDSNGNIAREAQQFYQLAYLATWLANNRATPLRNVVSDADRRDCILAANAQRAQRGEPPLRVPSRAPAIPAMAYPLNPFPAQTPAPRRRETQGEPMDPISPTPLLQEEERLFQQDGQTWGQKLFDFYETLSDANNFYYRRDELKKARMQKWMADQDDLSARAVYALRYVTAQESSDMERVPRSLPSTQAPELPYAPQEGDSLFRRILGRMENYEATREVQRNYAELREARLRKSKLMAAAARAHCAAVCKPDELVGVEVDILSVVMPSPYDWAEGIVFSRPYRTAARRAFDDDVLQRSRAKRVDYANELASITADRAARARLEANAMVVASLASAAAAAALAAGSLVGLR
jgi:hypothetical protein